MSVTARFVVAAALACAPVLSALAEDAAEVVILGPHAEACAPSAAGPAVLVHIHGFKDGAGNIRVDLYPAAEGDFLAPRARLLAEGKVFARIDAPTPQTGNADMCVPLPAPGAYAIAVLHDRNASSKLDAFSDGYGFPNNPRLGYGKPSVEKATFTAGEGVTRLEIVLNYWNGLSSRPLRNPR